MADDELAGLTARANAAGFPTVSTWVDHLEDYAAGAYEAGESSVMADLDIAFDGLLPDGVAATPQELARYVEALQAMSVSVAVHRGNEGYAGFRALRWVHRAWLALRRLVPVS